MSKWTAQVHIQYPDGWFPDEDDFEYSVEADSEEQARLAVEDYIELYYIGDDEVTGKASYTIMEEE